MNDKVLCNSTKLMRGGTAYSSSPFELNLQLHGQVSNPYNFVLNRIMKVQLLRKSNLLFKNGLLPVLIHGLPLLPVLLMLK